VHRNNFLLIHNLLNTLDLLNLESKSVRNPRINRRAKLT
jgi:hypothetical protein